MAGIRVRHQNRDRARDSAGARGGPPLLNKIQYFGAHGFGAEYFI